MADPREESDGRVPPQPKTQQLAAADKQEILLAELKVLMVNSFGDVGRRLDNQDGILEKVVTEGIRTNTRLDRIELRVDEVEGRMHRASTGVRGLSQTDMAHDAQLAAERAAREALANKVDALTETQAAQLAILGRLDKIFSNPTVKVILFALGTLATGYLSAKGLK